jgi:hypothetical protein
VVFFHGTKKNVFEKREFPKADIEKWIDAFFKNKSSIQNC